MPNNTPTTSPALLLLPTFGPYVSEGVAVALASVSRPRLFEREPMAVDVETNGELTRGMTVFDRRGIPRWQSNIDVITDADIQGVADYLVDVLSTN